MVFRDILTVISSPSTDAHALDYAEALQMRWDTHLSAMIINCLPSMPMVAEGWMVDQRWDEVILRAREDMAQDRAALEERFRTCARCEIRSALIEWPSVRHVVGLHARHAGLSVVPAPSRDLSGDLRTDIVEGVLFGAGRPVVVVPSGAAPPPQAPTVFVCWNAGREASRALADATAFIETAGRVIVATVDAEPEPMGHGDLPGVDIAQHLSRFNANVEVLNIQSKSKSQARALMAEADRVSADLVVMGGYGRSRLSEFIFGGVTRDMLAETKRPMLMSH
ncbi:hypothetical protein GC169_11685 [bacterium]|nr:hypothetical protein [bacterium]